MLIKLKKNSENKVSLLIFFIACLLYVIAIAYDLSFIRNVASILLLIQIFRSNIPQLTAIIIGLAFLWHYCKFSSGTSLFFFFSLAATLRYLLLRRFNLSFRLVTYLIIIIIIIQQLSLVYFENHADYLLQWIGGISYFVIIMIDKKVEYEHVLTIKHLASSYLAITIGNILAGVKIYGYSFFRLVIEQGSFDYRFHFGQQLDPLGGSNAFPIISFILAFAVFNECLKAEKFPKKMAYLFISLFVMAFALLSFTRAYVISMFVIALVLFFQLFTKNIAKVYNIVVFGCIGILIIYLNSNTLQKIINGFLTRFTGNSNTSSLGGRIDLAIYFWKIISENIRIFIIGSGVKGYVFSNNNMMAHNIILDGILCFGVLGLGLIVLLFMYYARGLSQLLSKKPTVFSSLGIIALLIQWMSIGSFFYEYTLYYILFVIYSMYFGYTNQKNEIDISSQNKR